MKSRSNCDIRFTALLGVLVATAGLALGACSRQEDPAQTGRDMSEERAEGNERITDATKDAVDHLQDGATADTVANDAHRIEVEKIRADHDVAKQRCDGVPAADQDKCRAAADSAYDIAMKAADSTLESRRGAAPIAPVSPP